MMTSFQQCLSLRGSVIGFNVFLTASLWTGEMSEFTLC